MHRLFVALRPPRPMRDDLLEAMGGIPGARWQDDDQLHLTLRFIGEVERPVAEDVAVALGRVGSPRATVAVAGVGAFVRRGQPHTLWAGVQADEALGRLQRRIERTLVQAGIPPESRAFQPHITLARLGRTAASIESFLARHAALASPATTFDAFILYESHLSADGPTYTTIARYPLE